jgi:hypothetical protein
LQQSSIGDPTSGAARFLSAPTTTASNTFWISISQQFKHQWVSKLLGYDFTVEYKPGKQNTVADALSRRDATEPSLMALSEITFPIFDHLKAEITTKEEAGKLAQSIKTWQLSTAWTLEDDLILYKQRVHIPSSSPILQEVLHAIHNSTHEGSEKTLHRF